MCGVPKIHERAKTAALQQICTRVKWQPCRPSWPATTMYAVAASTVDAGRGGHRPGCPDVLLLPCARPSASYVHCGLTAVLFAGQYVSFLRSAVPRLPPAPRYADGDMCERVTLYRAFLTQFEHWLRRSAVHCPQMQPGCKTACDDHDQMQNSSPYTSPFVLACARAAGEHDM